MAGNNIINGNIISNYHNNISNIIIINVTIGDTI